MAGAGLLLIPTWQLSLVVARAPTGAASSAEALTYAAASTSTAPPIQYTVPATAPVAATAAREVPATTRCGIVLWATPGSP